MLQSIKSLLLLFIFSVISGISMFFAWPENNAIPLVFVSLIPLFYFTDKVDSIYKRFKGAYLFSLAFVAHYVWLCLSLAWLHTTSPKTYQLAIIIESLSFALIFIPLPKIRKRLGRNWSWIYLISAWMSLEFINQNWPMGTPYFLLGSGFGKYPQMIQFYSIVGIEGGSLLILLVNLGICLMISDLLQKKSLFKPILITAVGLAPFLLSLLHLFDFDSSQTKKIKVAAVHSYLETYADDSHNHPERTVKKLSSLMKKKDLVDVELVLWPETVISNLGWVSNIQGDLAFNSILQQLDSNVSYSICTGGYTYSVAEKNEDDPYLAFEAARKLYYKAHNVALTIDTNGLISIRSKGIFIPFQERIPYLKQLPFLKEWVDLVGANTMVSHYENSKNVHKTMNGIPFVPVLCFESTYPYFMAMNASQGALTVILANENWNKDLSGSDQYLHSNVAIAIQSRTAIARSSNSGISAMIGPDGEIIEKRKGKNEGTIVQDLPLKEDLTIYEMIAGTIYKLSIIVALSMFIWAVLNKLRGKEAKS